MMWLGRAGYGIGVALLIEGMASRHLGITVLGLVTVVLGAGSWNDR